VLEIGEFISAAYCTKLLADLGADVIKLESTGGDRARSFGPFQGDVPHPEKSGLFFYLNSNKRGMTADLGKPTARAILKQLAREADVVVENTPPGYIERLGIGYSNLRRLNPAIIVTSISTFGRSGPYCNYRGSDLTSWHASSAGHRYLGFPGREPLRGAWYQASYWGAVNAAAATMLALSARRRIGVGQQVDISEAESIATLFIGHELVTLFFDTGETAVRAGDKSRARAPSGLLPCKDGYVHIIAAQQHHWQGLVKAMGEPDWAKDQIFNTSGWERVQYAAELYDLLSEWSLAHTKEEIFKVCQDNHVPVTPVYNVAELVDSQHLHERCYFAECDHPLAGRWRVPGAPYKLTETPWQLDTQAPCLGEHNESVLCGRLGFSKRELASLVKSGVI